MLRKTSLLAFAAMLVAVTMSSKVQAWGAYHVGYSHYGPNTGFHHYGSTGVYGGGAYGSRYHTAGGAYGSRYGSYGGYHYGGYHYGASGGGARYGYYRRW